MGRVGRSGKNVAEKKSKPPQGATCPERKQKKTEIVVGGLSGRLVIRKTLYSFLGATDENEPRQNRDGSTIDTRLRRYWGLPGSEITDRSWRRESGGGAKKGLKYEVRRARGGRE